MRSRAAQPLVAVAILAASLAAFVHSSAAARRQSLAQAAGRTAAQSSLSFDLTAQIETVGKLPYVLHAKGALGQQASHVAMKVADLHLPDGRVLTGPSAVELTDGTFLYLRGTVTQSLGAGLWVREPLAALNASSPELKILRTLSPRALLVAAGRVRAPRSSDGGRVVHGRLSYSDPVVSGALARLEANTQFRDLRLTAWVSPEGKVRMLLLRGRTADKTSTFLLAVTLDRFGKPVAVTPPRAGSFVDFGLSRLAS